MKPAPFDVAAVAANLAKLGPYRDYAPEWAVDDWRIVVSVDPDNDYSIVSESGEDVWCGRLEWASNSDNSRRPDGFDGGTMKIRTEVGESLWWQPPADLDHAGREGMRAMIADVLDNGADEYTVTIDGPGGHGEASLCGCFGYNAESLPSLIGELIDEALAEVTDRRTPPPVLRTRAERSDRPSHEKLTPPDKLAPADDPSWASTLVLAELAKEMRAAAERVTEVADNLKPPDRDDTRTLEFNGVTVTIGTSTGTDGAALVIIDTEGEPDGSDGWKGLRVDVNDARVFEGVAYDNVEPVAAARRHETAEPAHNCRLGAKEPRSVTVKDHAYVGSFCPVHGTQPNLMSPCGSADIIEYHVTSMKEDGTPLADGRYRVRFDTVNDQLIIRPFDPSPPCTPHTVAKSPTFPTDGSMETAP